jgi:hypothetical protein
LIVADEHDVQPWGSPMSGAKSVHALPHLVTDLLRYRLAVDDLRHAGRL